MFSALLVLGAGSVQAFTSGSTGADGALSIPVGDGSPQTILFDPASFTPALDTDGDGVYHFTTVTVPANITVRLRADKCGTLPLHWLATGNVIIAGTVDLSGTAVSSVPFGQLPGMSIPGPGGFPGGLGVTPTSVNMTGFGPGAGVTPGSGGSFSTLGSSASGAAYGNGYLLPLVGGSGGTSAVGSGTSSGSGGAGGGALLIASSTSITLDGSILSRGGLADDAQLAGDGSGGAVRLMAPSFGGTGVISVLSATTTRVLYGGDGWIRVEALTNTFAGTYQGTLRVVTLNDSSPIGATDPRTKITVLNVNGVAVSARPGGTFTLPDVAISAAGLVAINVRFDNPPALELVEARLYLFNETEFTTSVLPSSFTGTNPITLRFDAVVPSGFTRGFVSMTPVP